VYAVTSQGFAPLPSARRLGDAAFDWGRPGEGVYELAWAMLAAATSARPPAAVCGLFDRWRQAVVGDRQRARWPPVEP